MKARLIVAATWRTKDQEKDIFVIVYFISKYRNCSFYKLPPFISISCNNISDGIRMCDVIIGYPLDL